jgi:Domain of unknown function (DUF4105)
MFHCLRALLTIPLRIPIFIALFAMLVASKANGQELQKEAAHTVISPELIARIDVERLHDDPQWHALIHYYSRRWHLSPRGQADAKDFYLSQQGKSDPRAELIATIQLQFFSTDSNAVICKFPARFTWLRQRLALSPDRTSADLCPEVRAWSTSLQADRLSVVFAAAFLESPSSLFGHTFLLFHNDGAPPLLARTLNYAADSARQKDPIDFVFRGLFGGFPGVIDEQPFFRRIRTYADDEGRDLWEYDLELSQQQIELLTLHAWEIKDGAFDYFFLGENCSYRTLALLQVARPDVTLVNIFRGAVVPVDTVRRLVDTGLVRNSTLWPSSTKTLYSQAQQLTPTERTAAIAIGTGSNALSELQKIKPERRALIANIALQFLSLEINRGLIPIDRRAPLQNELMSERAQYAAPTMTANPPEFAHPETQHRGHAIAPGWSVRDGAGAATLGVAAFQHTAFDPLRGYEKGAGVTVLAASLRYESSDIALDSVDLLNIRSTAPSTDFFQRTSWQLRLGRTHEYVGGEYIGVDTLSYSRGKSIDTAVGTLTSFVGIDFDINDSQIKRFMTQANFDIDITRQSERFTGQLYAHASQDLWGKKRSIAEYGLRIGIPVGNCSAFLFASRTHSLNTVSSFGIEARYHF